MVGSFSALIRAMVEESRDHIAQLREYVADPELSRTQHHAINDVLHAETLRLDMLRGVLTNWEPS